MTTKRRKDKSLSPPQTIGEVATRALDYFGDSLHDDAVAIRTPFPDRVPLDGLALPKEIRELLNTYEPLAAKEGLYPHQADVIRRTLAGEGPHFLLTSATGSGKSLAFWTWVLHHLQRDDQATALVCFPTQALLWSQAERLARTSVRGTSRRYDDVSYGGALRLGAARIGWTVWKGTGQGKTLDRRMREHQSTPAFADARIRLATLDKAHYSLIRDADFVRRLACVVIDEAHGYDGVFGANVHFFLKRLLAALDLSDRPRPAFFLASATLGNAADFARTLLSLRDTDGLVHVSDATRQEIRALAPSDVPSLLDSPPAGSLLRAVLLLDTARAQVRTEAFLSDLARVGDHVNALCFVESKFHGRQLAMRLRGKGRDVQLYDADLPPRDRRRIEAAFNSGRARGTTLIATNALELGIDIENLDLCLLDQTPPVRQALLQRIGRVGRRGGRPGLVILACSLFPRDRRMIDAPEEAFRLDTATTLPLPVHLDMARWRHMLAAYNEGLYRTHATKNWPRFSRVMKQHFGECPDHAVLKARFEAAFGNAIDMEGEWWAHDGFRASASQGKVPLIQIERVDDDRPVPRMEDGHRCDVAWIDRNSLFRDAHPEGIYLAHDGRRWRVVAYDGEWKQARNAPRGTEVVLAKWLKSIDAAYVEPVEKHIVTRGDWEDHEQLYERIVDLPTSMTAPRTGAFEYGTWDSERRWKGYREIDLHSGLVTRVPLGEVMERFWGAMDEGQNFPFLHPLTYRTLGWRWDCGQLTLPEGGETLQSLLLGFVSAELECGSGDVRLSLSADGHALCALDAAPGGNGLSRALLEEGRMSSALEACGAVLHARQEDGGLRQYLERLLDVKLTTSPEGLIDVVDSLRERWDG